MNKVTLSSEKCQLYFDNDTGNKKVRRKEEKRRYINEEKKNFTKKS